MSCTRDLLEEKLQYSRAAHQPFTDSMATYYSVMDKFCMTIQRSYIHKKQSDQLTHFQIKFTV